jgi:uncharacterized protein YkwD
MPLCLQARRIVALVVSCVLVVNICPSILVHTEAEKPFKKNAGSGWNSTRQHNIEPGWYATEVLRMINENRTGLKPMTLNASLMWLANDYAKYLADNSLFTHIVDPSSPPPYNGTNPKSRMNGVDIYSLGRFGSYFAVQFSENLDGASSTDPYSSMQNFMSSTPHRDTILDPNLNEVGTGGCQGAGNERAVQNFGRVAKDIDIGVVSADISFDPPDPAPGDSVIIRAVVSNTGFYDAYPVCMKAYDGDPSSGGTLIGSVDIPIIFINGDMITVNITFDTTGKSSGVYPIYVIADAQYPSNDTNPGNNVAIRNLGLGVNIPETCQFMMPFSCITAILIMAVTSRKKTRG